MNTLKRFGKNLAQVYPKKVSFGMAPQIRGTWYLTAIMKCNSTSPDTQGTLHFVDTQKVTVDLIPTTLELFAKTPTTVGLKVWDINPLAHWKLELFDTKNALVEQVEGSGTPPTEVTLSKIQANPNAIYTGMLQVQDIAGNRSTEQAQLQFGMGSQPTNASTPKLTLMVGSFEELYYAETMETRLRQQNPDQKVALRAATVDGKNDASCNNRRIQHTRSGCRPKAAYSRDPRR